MKEGHSDVHIKLGKHTIIIKMYSYVLNVYETCILKFEDMYLYLGTLIALYSSALFSRTNKRMTLMCFHKFY